MTEDELKQIPEVMALCKRWYWLGYEVGKAEKGETIRVNSGQGFQAPSFPLSRKPEVK